MCCLCYDKNYPNQLYPTNHAETRKRGGSQKHPQSVSTYLHTHALALAILAALCVGVLTGLINGFVITYYKLAPFIVTLAMQFMARFGGPFPPILRFEKLEILRSRWRRRSLTDAAMPLRVHKVYLRFPNLDLTKNLSPNQLAESCGVA